MFNRYKTLILSVSALALSTVSFASTPSKHGKLKELIAAQNKAAEVFAGEGLDSSSGVYGFLAGHGVKVQFCQAGSYGSEVKKVYYCENDHGKTEWKCEAEDISGKQLACGLESAAIKIADVAEALRLSGKQILTDKPRGYNSTRDVITVPSADGVKAYFCKKNRSSRKLEIAYQYNCTVADSAMSCQKATPETDHGVCTAVTKAD